MTLAEHLALPIGERIKRYEEEFIWGDPDFTSKMKTGVMRTSGRCYNDKELHEYVLYRLKREDYELRELKKKSE